MQKSSIKNFNELATTENRELALIIAESGLAAINTEEIILNSIKLQDNILNVAGESFILSKFKKLKLLVSVKHLPMRQLHWKKF